MKFAKMDVFKILKFLSVCAVSALLAFVFQHYLNLRANVERMSEDLKIAVFLKDGVEKETASSAMAGFTDFDVVEFVDKDKSYEKALELNPELGDVIPSDTISYPAYFLINGVKASDTAGLEKIKDGIMNTGFASDVVYDAKGFGMLFDETSLVSEYEKIAVSVFTVLVVLFAVKAALFAVKKRYKDIAVELLLGCLSSLSAYVIICISAAITYNPVYVLDWHILFVLIPLGAVICFLTEETNA